jgi:ankyrin repeat protein
MQTRAILHHLIGDPTSIVVSYLTPPDKTAFEICKLDGLREVSSVQEPKQGLLGACYGGHLELAKLMIKHGADNFNNGLNWACRNGHLELVNLVIEHGADDFNQGLIAACMGGHLELAKLMIGRGAYSFNRSLRWTVHCGHHELTKLLIEHGADRYHVYTVGFN